LLNFVAKPRPRPIDYDKFARIDTNPEFFKKRSVINNNFAHTTNAAQSTTGEEMSDYVAHLQMHMALQARNLVPTLTNTADPREQLLHQTQAHFEKLASRQLG
jgi:uncharacterized membrane-anchored protein YhcB (DUF1043 family)